MKLSQGQKLIVGFFTLLPFVLIPYYLYQFFHFFTEMMQNTFRHEEPDPTMILEVMMPMFMAVGLMSLVSMGLLVFYIIHAVKNKAVVGNERLIWILLFVFVAHLAFPIYFFLRVWKDEDVPAVKDPLL
jgi:hypothetical protein